MASHQERKKSAMSSPISLTLSLSNGQRSKCQTPKDGIRIWDRDPGSELGSIPSSHLPLPPPTPTSHLPPTSLVKRNQTKTRNNSLCDTIQDTGYYTVPPFATEFVYLSASVAILPHSIYCSTRGLHILRVNVLRAHR